MSDVQAGSSAPTPPTKAGETTKASTDEKPSKVWEKGVVAAISGIASLVVALVTTFGTIRGSDSRLKELQKNTTDVAKQLNAAPIVPPGTIVPFGGEITDSNRKMLKQQ